MMTVHSSSLITHHSIARGIHHSRLRKPALAQQARVAMPARPPFRVGVVARERQRIVDAERNAATDDVGFRHLDQWRNESGLAVLDSAARAAKDHVLKCCDELRPAVGIAAVIDSIHPYPYLPRPPRLGQPEGDCEKD